jgi:hypothetical protein
VPDTPPDRIDADDNWVGGYYELALELGERDDARLEAAFHSMRELAQVDSFWAHVNLKPSKYESVSPTLSSLLQFALIRGTLKLPNGRMVVCGLNAVREEAEPPHYAPDWLVLGVPLGALIKIEPRVGGYPFGSYDSSLAWRQPIDEWLAVIGSQIFATTNFRLGLIGMETSGEAYSDRLENGIPAKRSFGYLWPEDGKLRYFPATE